jgi:phosphatidate cytidylyltransferase
LLIQRITTGAIFGVAVIASVLLLPTPWAAGVLALLFLIGSWEWAGLALLPAAARGAYTAAFAVAMLTAPWWIGSRALVIVLLFFALLFWALALAAVLSFPRRLSLAGVAVSGVAALLPPWVALAYLHGARADGPWLVMTVLALVWSADVGAFFTGRAVGRRKLAPHVSPGKTWEGVGGGVVLAAVVAGAAAAALGLPVGRLVAIGAGTAVVSVLGDLTVSIGKRNIGVKDTGKLLPGHGGMLDRIDSLTAAAPVFVLGLIAAALV